MVCADSGCYIGLRARHRQRLSYSIEKRTETLGGGGGDGGRGGGGGAGSGSDATHCGASVSKPAVILLNSDDIDVIWQPRPRCFDLRAVSAALYCGLCIDTRASLGDASA